MTARRLLRDALWAHYCYNDALAFMLIEEIIERYMNDEVTKNKPSPKENWKNYSEDYGGSEDWY